ncbi:MAG: DUF4911 domain-containing protein [Deltaproteobacteria bacterium]|nr:DUF4911 domain-containing protein [Deltaproteobacteria bacterium]
MLVHFRHSFHIGTVPTFWHDSCENVCYVYLIKTLETSKRYYRVDRSEIAYLRFIFEAYDGIAVVKTVDAQKGIIVLRIAPGCEDDVEYVLQDLKKEIMIETAHV